MYAMTVYAKLPDSTDWDAMRALARERAPLYQTVEGLISKAFVVDPHECLYGAHYLWHSRDDAEAFLASGTFQSMAARFTDVAVRLIEVAAFIQRSDAAVSQHHGRFKIMRLVRGW